jgi:hypothetical protein
MKTFAWRPCHVDRKELRSGIWGGVISIVVEGKCVAHLNGCLPTLSKIVITLYSNSWISVPHQVRWSITISLVFIGLAISNLKSFSSAPPSPFSPYSRGSRHGKQCAPLNSHSRFFYASSVSLFSSFTNNPRNFVPPWSGVVLSVAPPN